MIFRVGFATLKCFNGLKNFIPRANIHVGRNFNGISVKIVNRLFMGLYKNLWVKSSNNEGILCYGKPSF